MYPTASTDDKLSYVLDSLELEAPSSSASRTLSRSEQAQLEFKTKVKESMKALLANEEFLKVIHEDSVVDEICKQFLLDRLIGHSYEACRYRLRQNLVRAISKKSTEFREFLTQTKDTLFEEIYGPLLHIQEAAVDCYYKDPELMKELLSGEAEGQRYWDIIFNLSSGGTQKPAEAMEYELAEDVEESKAPDDKEVQEEFRTLVTKLSAESKIGRVRPLKLTEEELEEEACSWVAAKKARRRNY